MVASAAFVLASRDSASPVGEPHPTSQPAPHLTGQLTHLTPGHVASLGLDGVRRALEQVAAAQRHIDAVRIILNGRLRELSTASPAVMPEQVIVKATSVSRPDARRDMQRVDTLDAFPQLRDAVLAGDISAHHVDVVTRAVRHLDNNSREIFATDVTRLVGIARRTSP
ncbi:MAG: DUF222 domain-containing protein, partial [Acidobacteria bacterium]|nr:DUF222 domain-containing protein [Acidobacteriota bacterium]